MPYITKHIRPGLDKGGAPMNAGELAYKLYRVINQYLTNSRSFAQYAEALGALEAVKLELWAREIGPYEARKREVNGDV